MKKIILLSLFLVFFITSVNANSYYNSEGNAGDFISSYLQPFASTTISHHGYTPDICTINQGSDYDTLINDLDGDGQNEIFISDSSGIYVYNFTCGLEATLITGSVFSSPLITDDDEIVYLSSGGLKVFTYNNGYINSKNISDGRSYATQYVFGCDMITKNCITVVSNTNYVLYNIDSSSVINKSYSSLGDVIPPQPFHGNMFNRYTFSDVSGILFTNDRNFGGTDTRYLNILYENGSSTVNVQVTASATFSAFPSVPLYALGSDTTSKASRIYLTAKESSDATIYQLFDGTFTSQKQVFVRGGFVTNFALSKWEIGNIFPYACLIRWNVSDDQYKLNCYDSTATLVYDIPFEVGMTNETGIKSLYMADFTQSNAYIEVVTEDGIFSYDGSSWDNLVNITAYRSGTGGGLSIAYKDTTTGINYAVYTESDQAVVFGLLGVDEVIVPQYCGDDICQASIGEDEFSCPIDCDILFSSGGTCTLHTTPPCVYETYFDYQSPTTIEHKGWTGLANNYENIYPVNGKLDLSSVSSDDVRISRYVPYTNKPYYTFEFKLNVLEAGDVFTLGVGEFSDGFNQDDRVSLVFDNKNIGYYSYNSFGILERKNICNDCFNYNEENLYKILFFFEDSRFDIFDNKSNSSEKVNKNTYALQKANSVLGANIPFLSTDNLEDGKKYDYISFGFRDTNYQVINITLDNIYIYEGSNNLSSNVDDILIQSFEVFNKTKTCTAGICSTGRTVSQFWDCSVEPECCGYRNTWVSGEKQLVFSVDDPICVGRKLFYAKIIEPILKYMYTAILPFIVIVILGGIVLILYLKSKKN